MAAMFLDTKPSERGSLTNRPNEDENKSQA